MSLSRASTIRNTLAFALVCSSHVVRAQSECATPEARVPRFVTPSVGAQGVPVNALLSVDYRRGFFASGDAPALDAIVELSLCGSGCGQTCSATSAPVAMVPELLADRVFLRPTAMLAANSSFSGIARGIDGDLPFSFCTGSVRDTMPPGTASVRGNNSTEVGASCELPDGGYRVGVFVAPASDDGPPGSIEYLLFLTRASGLREPILVDRVRNYAAESINLSFLLDGVRVAAPVCVEVIAVDGQGQSSRYPGPYCFDPLTKVRFQGANCAISHVRYRCSMWVMLLFLMLWRAKRRLPVRISHV